MPLVNRTFDQLIDFTRTSAATFVNSSGNIALTPQSRNLFTFTQEFDNAAWSKTNLAISANATTAPDGTSTADKVVKNATTSAAFVGGFVSLVGNLTFSVYLKAAEQTNALIYIENSGFSGTGQTVVDLSTGGLTNSTTGTGVAITSTTATLVGNGWYRVTLSLNVTSGTAVVPRVYPCTAAGATNILGDGASGFFMWGAQIEASSTATDYTRNFGGLFPPRFDYDPVTRAPRGLLIEEQRTNLLVRSEDFDNAAWTVQRTTVSANATTSPDGTVDADKLVEDTTASNTHFVLQTATVVAATTYSYSVFLKASERTRASLQDGGGSSAIGNFDLSNGTVISASGATATITSFGNGWYRCTITFTTGGAQTVANCRIFLIDTGTNTSYTGDGTSGIFVWGAQLEAGAFATSYIPTVASQVTRSADVAAINAPNFASWYNQSEGSFIFEGDSNSVVAGMFPGTIQVTDGTTSNRIGGYLNQAAGTYTTHRTLSGASVSVATGNATAQNTVFKAAAAFSASSGVVAVLNGGTVATNATSTFPTVNQLQLGLFDQIINGHIRSVRFYPTRLTNAQLQALTA